MGNEDETERLNPFILIDQLCQAYHWTLPEAMRLTWPQILMLNHAAWVNGKRFDESRNKATNGDAPVMGNKRLEELNSDEMAQYYADWT